MCQGALPGSSLKSQATSKSWWIGPRNVVLVKKPSDGTLSYLCNPCAAQHPNSAWMWHDVHSSVAHNRPNGHHSVNNSAPTLTYCLDDCVFMGFHMAPKWKIKLECCTQKWESRQIKTNQEKSRRNKINSDKLRFMSWKLHVFKRNHVKSRRNKIL